MKRKLIIFTIILTFILAATVFWYYWRNIYSKEILKLEILGPENVELAQEFEYTVRYKNNGNITLEEPKLIFEYPENSIVIEGENSSGNSLRQERKLDDIYPGQEYTFSFKARLLGKENEARVAKTWLSYRPKNLKARFESNTTFTTIIKNIPLTLEFDFPSKIEPGRNTLFRLNYFSNTDYPLSDLRIRIEYPASFELLESRPKSLGENEWEIPLLNKAEGGRIEISGTLQGEVQESKIFRASLGIWQEEKFVLLKETVRGVEIARPSIFISQQINGSPQYIANPGDYLHYEIFFKNTGERVLENLFLVARLEGEAFDFDKIQAGAGVFQKDSSSILWDNTMVSQLRFLSGMEEGKVEFWIKVKEDLGGAKNPTLTNKVSISQAREEFVTRISSKLEIVQKGYFSDEVFGNTGPIPPRVGETTTYTIFWQVKNYYSDVKNVKVKTTLPQGVELTARIFPEEESSRFAFDSQSREIVWSVGDLEKGKGVSIPGPSISFQVSLIPSQAQKGDTPEIINATEITGEDNWAEMTLRATTSSIDTTLPDDLSITDEQGVVQ